jgi:fatty-acyl-CoA synthase
MIRSGGENVASREVEEMIYRLPQVSEVAVIGVPHPKWVEAVAAVIVVKAGQSLTEQEVIDHCTSTWRRSRRRRAWCSRRRCQRIRVGSC